MLQDRIMNIIEEKMINYLRNVAYPIKTLQVYENPKSIFLNKNSNN